MEDVPVDVLPQSLPVEMPRGRGVSVGMASLDEVHLPSIFEYRAHVMRSIPRIMKGAYRSAMRIALQEAAQARTEGSELKLIRVWKMSPHQYALKTRAGCECVAHLLQSLTDFDEGATVVSVDGVGAFDLVSRNAMLNGFLEMVDGEQLLPFARLFYSQPSTYLWDDDAGTTHRIQQGEGGEQGDDALMPLLSSLG